MASKQYNLLLVAMLGLFLLCMMPQPSFSKKSKPKQLDFYMLIVVQNLTRLSSPGEYTAVRSAAPAVEQNFTFGVLSKTQSFDNRLSKTQSFDNRLSKTQSFDNRLGWYGDCGQDQLTLCIAQTFTYDDGTFKGTFSLIGVSVATEPLKYAAVVGGTGDFAFCRGVASQHRISDVSINNEENAIFSYSITFKF